MAQTPLADAAIAEDQRARRGTLRPARRWLWLLLKLLLAALGFAFILSRQPWSELEAALAKLSLPSFVLSIALSVLCLAVATLRWRLLMRAYGADLLPGFATLFRVYFVGHFYNTYIPGGVGGDVLRGVVMRRSFAAGGTTKGVAIVFVERALGLLGVLGVFVVVAPFGADVHLRQSFAPYCVLGALAVVGMVLAVAVARRLADYAPGRVAVILRNLPALSHVAPFAGACLLSVLTQALVALGGHVLLASIYSEARLIDSLIAMPLAAAAAFLPVSVAGAGPRDVVLVALYGALGVPRAVAVATALAFLVCTLLVSGLGGLLQLMAPLTQGTDPGRD